MRWLIVFLLGATCGAAALFFLSGPWSASPERRGGTAGDFRVAAAVTVQAPVASVALVAPGVDAAELSATLAPVVLNDLQPPSSAVQARPAAFDAIPAEALSVDVSRLDPSALNGLLLPVSGVKVDDLVDTFTQARGTGRVHDAIDIMAARGTPVVAVNDGHVVKLFSSKPGGLTVYQFDPHDQVIYYYAHLDSYAPGLVEGQILRRGDPIGFVGSTGNASAYAPHLHFEIEILGQEKQWWHATSINPYGRFVPQP